MAKKFVFPAELLIILDSPGTDDECLVIGSTTNDPADLVGLAENDDPVAVYEISRVMRFANKPVLLNPKGD